MRNITVQPTLVKDLKTDDLFRDGGQNFRIAGFERDEVTYYIGIGDLVNSFYLSPDDTLDKIINQEN